MSAYTLTFGDCGENDSRGMEKIGKQAVVGLSVAELFTAKNLLAWLGFEAEIYDLKQALPQHLYHQAEEAAVLIIRNGVNILCRDIIGEISTMTTTWTIPPLQPNIPNEMYKELSQIPMDKHTVKMRKPTIDGKKMNYTVPTLFNKIARHNICIGDYDQKPDIINGKGTIVNFIHLPNINLLRSRLHLFFGHKTLKLIGEINHYYDIKTCGINYHGDTERRIVIGVRLGTSFPLAFKWYQHQKPCSAPFEIPLLHHGDIYVMSEKAVGYDWKLHGNDHITVRHAAGFDGFIHRER